MKSALISVAWNSDDWTFDALESHYQTLVKYLNLKDLGVVLGIKYFICYLIYVMIFAFISGIAINFCMMLA